MDKQLDEQARTNEAWRAFFTGDNQSFHRAVRVFHLLPASPRCKMCQAPFGDRAA